MGRVAVDCNCLNKVRDELEVDTPGACFTPTLFPKEPRWAATGRTVLVGATAISTVELTRFTLIRRVEGVEALAFGVVTFGGLSLSVEGGCNGPAVVTVVEGSKGFGVCSAVGEFRAGETRPAGFTGAFLVGQVAGGSPFSIAAEVFAAIDFTIRPTPDSGITSA